MAIYLFMAISIEQMTQGKLHNFTKSDGGFPGPGLFTWLGTTFRPKNKMMILIERHVCWCFLGPLAQPTSMVATCTRESFVPHCLSLTSWDICRILHENFPDPSNIHQPFTKHRWKSWSSDFVRPSVNPCVAKVEADVSYEHPSLHAYITYGYTIL